MSLIFFGDILVRNKWFWTAAVLDVVTQNASLIGFIYRKESEQNALTNQARPQLLNFSIALDQASLGCVLKMLAFFRHALAIAGLFLLIEFILMNCQNKSF